MDFFPRVEKLLETALRRGAGRVSLSQVERGLLESRFGLWIVTRGERITGAGVSEILEFERKRVLSVFMYAGERRGVMHLWPVVEEVARVIECNEVQIAGSRAWGRLFPEYRESFTVFTKEVR